MAIEVYVEAELYEATRRFVNTHFRQQLRERAPFAGLQLFVEDTSTAGGSDSGYWSKPDVSALALARGQFVPYWRADLHTFEVKTASGLAESAVHEANAHGRFGQYSWLVFQATGKSAPETTNFKKVLKLAAQMGVGIVHFYDTTSPKSWVIAHWAQNTRADAASADAFVRERFAPTLKARISSHLGTLGWPGISDEH